MKARFPLAATLLLVAGALPLAQVSAHECSSTTMQAPEDPRDPDTGCNGSSCPCTSAPHEHANTVPQNSCAKDADDCPDRRPGCRPGPVEDVAASSFTLTIRYACVVADTIVIVGRDTGLGDVVNVDTLP